MLPADSTTYTDPAVPAGFTYYYQVFASNLVGYTANYPPPAAGFPNMSADSVSVVSNAVTVP